MTNNKIPGAPALENFFKRKYNKTSPVDGFSIALFRLGEECNNDCLMCVNGEKSNLTQHSGEELIRRADFLKEQGLTRAVLTGGEPSIHPSFWKLIDHMNSLNMIWDINTNGKSFHDNRVAKKATGKGLRRAIVSFHSHVSETMEYISGAPGSYDKTIYGIENLIDAGARVMLNCVINTYNRKELKSYVRYCAERFQGRCTIKFVFPLRVGRGKEWDGVELQFKDIKTELCEAHTLGKMLGLQIFYESIPNCILEDDSIFNLGRTGFGETHYLEDKEGRRLTSMLHLDSLGSIYAPLCSDCVSLKNCCGISKNYIYQYGIDEFSPLQR